MTSPTLTYDRDANALYIRFTSHDVAETVELSESIYVDLDREGEPVGFEVLHAEPEVLAALPATPNTAVFRDLLRQSAS
jgi:uncharacterized protein YuzE